MKSVGALNALACIGLLGLTQASCVCHQARRSAAGEHALTVLARAHPGAPDDWDIQPGDPVVGARAELESLARPDCVLKVGTTDAEGRVVFMLDSGSYQVCVTGDTRDPYCWWYGCAEVEITDGPAEAAAGFENGLLILCE